MSRYVAAVDLGSHTFALVVARADGAKAGFRTVDVVKERVALTHGLGTDGQLSRGTVDRALAVLARFGERLRGFEGEDVCVVGTSALRLASGETFRQAAEHTLGFPIQIIEGQTEARLVYLGVAHGGVPHKRRLVFDVGGGSTELAVGDKTEPTSTWSQPMGHLERARELGRSWSPSDFLALRDETATALSDSVELGDAPKEVIGSGGTARAVAKVLAKRGGRKFNIARDDLQGLVHEIGERGSDEDMALSGLSARRRPTFAGGVLLVAGLMEALDIDRIVVSPRGLREGVLHDLLDFPLDDELLERTVLRVERRYGVDTEHGARVRERADEMAQAASLGPRARTLLGYAARLHQLGQALRHLSYHKAGGRILRKSSLPGFAPVEQNALAALVRLHRPDTKVRNKHLARIGDGDLQVEIERAVLLLRLAVIETRGRQSSPLELDTSDERISVRVPKTWLVDRPLTTADLTRETKRWRKRTPRLEVCVHGGRPI